MVMIKTLVYLVLNITTNPICWTFPMMLLREKPNYGDLVFQTKLLNEPHILVIPEMFGYADKV